MTREKALDKIAKLLALAGSDNPNEARLARSHAERMMREFAVTELDLEAGEYVIERVGGSAGFVQFPSWVHGIATACDAFFGTFSLYTSGWISTVSGRHPAVYILTGRPEDVAGWSYLFDVLVRDVRAGGVAYRERLAAAGRPPARADLNRFRAAMSYGIARRIAGIGRTVAPHKPGAAALTVADKQAKAKAEYLKRNGRDFGSASTTRLSGSRAAEAAGAEAASRVSVRGAVDGRTAPRDRRLTG